jgi:hypothetical protein
MSYNVFSCKDVYVPICTYDEHFFKYCHNKAETLKFVLYIIIALQYVHIVHIWICPLLLLTSRDGLTDTLIYTYIITMHSL